MKLIELLVKELPKRGGWPERAKYAWQDWDKQVRPESHGFGFYANELADNHRRRYEVNPEPGDDNCVTLSQYESALAKNDDWIEWGGGECPVDGDVVVDVKLNGHDGVFTHIASTISWRHVWQSANIIAYRPHRDINSRSNDDRLEQDLNEFIGQDVDAPCSDAHFPPEGIEIEYSTHGQGAWYRGIVTACGESMCIVKNLSGAEQAFHKFDIEFRPLRTEAEKAREAACHEIASMIGRGTFFEDAERIYDAGYRKEVK